MIQAMTATVAPLLHLDAQGMSAQDILRAIAQELAADLAQHASEAYPGPLPESSTEQPLAQVAVDVTDAWSIPWTTQPLEIPLGSGRSLRAFVRHKGFRHRAQGTEAVYEVTG